MIGSANLRHGAGSAMQPGELGSVHRCVTPVAGRKRLTTWPLMSSHHSASAVPSQAGPSPRRSPQPTAERNPNAASIFVTADTDSTGSPSSGSAIIATVPTIHRCRSAMLVPGPLDGEHSWPTRQATANLITFSAEMQRQDRAPGPGCCWAYCTAHCATLAISRAKAAPASGPRAQRPRTRPCSVGAALLVEARVITDQHGDPPRVHGEPLSGRSLPTRRCLHSRTATQMICAHTSLGGLTQAAVRGCCGRSRSPASPARQSLGSRAHEGPRTGLEMFGECGRHGPPERPS